MVVALSTLELLAFVMWYHSIEVKVNLVDLGLSSTLNRTPKHCYCNCSCFLTTTRLKTGALRWPIDAACKLPLNWECAPCVPYRSMSTSCGQPCIRTDIRWIEVEAGVNRATADFGHAHIYRRLTCHSHVCAAVSRVSRHAPAQSHVYWCVVAKVQPWFVSQNITVSAD
jgi:hypothetical protein